MRKSSIVTCGMIMYICRYICMLQYGRGEMKDGKGKRRERET